MLGDLSEFVLSSYSQSVLLVSTIACIETCFSAIVSAWVFQEFGSYDDSTDERRFRIIVIFLGSDDSNSQVQLCRFDEHCFDSI